MSTMIANARLVLPEGVCSDGWLWMEDGLIRELGQGRPPCGAYQWIDAGGDYLTPGFIDLHVHGGAGHDFMDGSEAAFFAAAKEHLRHGTTSLLPTTVSSSMEELFHVIECYQRVKETMQGGPHLLGLHLEGPFLAPAQAGAQDPKYLCSPLPERYLPILERGGADIARISAAVELEGAMELGDELRKRGIMAAIAHSDAEYFQVAEGIEHGFTHVTHLYSGMSSLHRIGAYRHLGVVESAYLRDELTVEIIADGRHLPPELLRLIVKSIPKERIILITDAMRGAGMPEGSVVALGSLTNGRPAIIENGVAFLPDHTSFAGSVCTADRCVRVMVQEAGVPLEDAVSMMTVNPARLLGLSHRKGSLKPGMDADVCLLGENLTADRVFVSGKEVPI